MSLFYFFLISGRMNRKTKKQQLTEEKKYVIETDATSFSGTD